MAKTETIHARVNKEVKEQAQILFDKIGLSVSQAIALFLKASINNNGLPFELNASKSKEDDDCSFGCAIAMSDGVMPSEESQKILRLYSRGDIDYETAMFAIKRLYKKD